MPNRRILIIDDDTVVLDMLNKTLAMHDFDVLAAPDGEQGISLFEQQRPDLVIVDIAMPHINGYQVIQRIRAIGGDVATPIVILTAFPQSVTQQDDDAIGADLYLTKPISSTMLIEFINRLLPAQ